MVKMRMGRCGLDLESIFSVDRDAFVCAVSGLLQTSTWDGALMKDGCQCLRRQASLAAGSWEEKETGIMVAKVDLLLRHD